MISPPCWILQQNDFMQDFISSLSFCISRREEGGWKNTLAEALWQEALVFVMPSDERERRGSNLSAARPHTWFVAPGPISPPAH